MKDYQLCKFNCSSLTLCLRHFTTFSATGVGFLSHTPENNVKIIWLIWNLVHIINGIRLLRMQNFKQFCVLFLEIWRHKICLFTRERFLAFRCLPWNSHLMMPKSLFIVKNNFSDLKLYTLRISAIFNKKKNFHVSKFSWLLVSKMTVATPPGKSILLKFSQIVAKR